MHAQHEQQILLKKAEHLNIMDKFAKRPLASLKQKYEDCYKTFEDLRKELEEGQMDEGERKRKLEYIRFEAGEIQEPGWFRVKMKNWRSSTVRW